MKQFDITALEKISRFLEIPFWEIVKYKLEKIQYRLFLTKEISTFAIYRNVVSIDLDILNPSYP